MCRSKLYNSIFSISCFALLLSATTICVADGDPTETIQADITVKETVASPDSVGTLLPDEQVAPPEEAVATVTADGDFLLPTYLLPGETATIERTTTVEKTFEQTPSKVTSVTIPVVQQTVATQKTTTTTTTPDDFGNLLQQVAPVTAPVAQNPTGQVAAQAATQSSAPVSTEVPETTKPTARPVAQKLLIPLAPVSVAKPSEPDLPPKTRFVVPSEYADQMIDSLKVGQQTPFKMPHELKITFYPRASAFSGQTLKWVRAFATAALQDPRLIVEIRASCAEASLQDTRLKLVKSVLAGAGLSTHQIVTNYTDRPVDTMLLRAVPRPEPSETVLTTKDIKLPKNMSRVKKW